MISQGGPIKIILEFDVIFCAIPASWLRWGRRAGWTGHR